MLGRIFSRFTRTSASTCCAALLLAMIASDLSAGPDGQFSSNDLFVNVRSCGAVGDGKAKDTKAIQSAIDKCSANGGTVYVPAGTYLSGPLFLRSNVTLYVDSGAKLLGSREWDDYPVVHGRWEGIETDHKAALITGQDLENVTIAGRGVIDGQGDAWWGEYHRLYKKKDPRAKYPRPRLINLINCKNVTIRDLTLQNSPSWTLHPVYCENLVIDGLTVLAPGGSPNTDGIDPDSCRLVRISNCNISVGDDCITLKSGKDADGRRVGRPCEAITITNCVMREGHGGVVIGSETSGGVRDVAVSNCAFIGTQRGIRFKTARGRGGLVENISFDNIVMRGLQKEAILMTMFYNGGAENSKPEPVTEATPIFRNVSISNIRAEGAASAVVCEGLPEMPISGLSLSNIRISATRGIGLLRVKDSDFRNIKVECKDGDPLKCTECDGVDVSDVRGKIIEAGGSEQAATGQK